MTIEQTYRRKFPGSAERYARATTLFPSGVTHDGRFMFPFPLSIERSRGAYKWDVDDNRVIDFWSGHGALLLGHGHPAIVAAVQAQVARGTHYGACHDLELRWGELVQRLVPGAELVRFTASGTEATMLALRLARAFTRRPRIIRFAGHFHGWHELIMPGAEQEDPRAGIPAALVESLITLPTEIAAVEQTLAQCDDIAAVILEPSGATYGGAPLPDSFLRELRTLTADRGVLLICDEVVTGFRVAPGGVQQRAGVIADLTCLAKVLAGGLPGGAVAGRADILRHLAFGDADWNAQQKIRHYGTYNANPLSAAAGCAMLELVATGEPCATATLRCRQIIAALNNVLDAKQMHNWTVYGDASVFHILVQSSIPVVPGDVPYQVPQAELKRGGDLRVLRMLRMALLNAGVDLMRGRSGFVSAVHSVADVAAMVAAFEEALDALRAEGMI
jgi:glutamate-1-semialdehyde 2,1-aminomutase